MGTEKQGEFYVEFGEQDTIRVLRNRYDEYEMNWAEGEHLWGTVICPEGIRTKKSHEWDGKNLKEIYWFKNESRYPIYIQKGDLGIYQTWNEMPYPYLVRR